MESTLTGSIYEPGFLHLHKRWWHHTSNSHFSTPLVPPQYSSQNHSSSIGTCLLDPFFSFLQSSKLLFSYHFIRQKSSSSSTICYWFRMSLETCNNCQPMKHKSSEQLLTLCQHTHLLSCLRHTFLKVSILSSVLKVLETFLSW